MPAPIEVLRPEVTTALNETTVGSRDNVSGQGGWLNFLTPLVPAGTAIPRGRMFAECRIVDQQGEPVGIGWRGYLVASSNGKVAGPTSSPGIYMQPGWGLVGAVTQTGQGAATEIMFRGELFAEPPGAGGFVFAEAPGSGAGELRREAIATPAAGADPAAKAVPAKCRWRPWSVFFKTVTSAAGGGSGRTARVFFEDASTNKLAAARALYQQSASRTVSYTFSEASASDASEPATNSFGQVACPMPTLAAGFTVNVFGVSDAADQMSEISVHVEEWAVP